MNREPGRTLLVFASGADGRDYKQRLGRLRWERALRPDRVKGVKPDASSSEAFAGAEDCVLVLDDTAIPASLNRFPAVDGEIVAAARLVAVSDLPAVHTLRELEIAPVPRNTNHPGRDSPALIFSARKFPPAAGESVEDFATRLRNAVSETLRDFPVVVFDDPFGYERSEVTRNLPGHIERLLDVGCGAGAASAALKRACPALVVTGIEANPCAAGRARACLDRVVEGDAVEGMQRLEALEERFDGFLFADVLEHLADPIEALTLARRLASDGATLVASVPNVGHLSLVRDLVFGRFDPLPAGLADAGHLRWFDRRFLGEALTEAGWSIDRVDALTGAPAPDAQQFLAQLQGLSDSNMASLMTYQWVVVARAKESETRDREFSVG